MILFAVANIQCLTSKVANKNICHLGKGRVFTTMHIVENVLFQIALECALANTDVDSTHHASRLIVVDYGDGLDRAPSSAKAKRLDCPANVDWAGV